MARLLAAALLLAALAASCSLATASHREAGEPAPERTAVLSREERDSGRVRLVETLTKRVYTVDGVTAQEVRENLNARGPGAAAGGGNGHFDGLTGWSLTWVFRYQRGPECALANATVTMDVEIVLPELAQPEALPPDLAARWQAYVEALEVHEIGHVERQLTLARTLQAEYEAAGGAATCAGLGSGLSALGEQYIERIRLADLQYDVETEHGRTQGAVFP